MKIFVTSGATVAFPQLISAFDEALLKSLADAGYDEVVIQYGHAAREFENGPGKQKGVDGFGFVPSIVESAAAADLVISHGGSGSILDVLRGCPPGKPLIIVVNESLMDNHQAELAKALDGKQALVSSLSDLKETVLRAKLHTFSALPPPASIEMVLRAQLRESQIYESI